MAELGSTNIDDLPVSPQTIQPNIQLSMNDDNIKVNNTSTNLQKKEEQTTLLNQVITGIQEASEAGMTTLPVRDIPTQQTHITNDRETRANYIPEGPDDYIKTHQSNDNIIRRNAEREQLAKKSNDIYDELSFPLMIGVLYFLFQLPVVRKNLFKILPVLFNKDGNPNLSGYIVNSVSFAMVCLLLMKGINYMSV